jgi:hypothetical protein
MNKKLLLAIVCIAVIGIAETAVFAASWMSKFNNIYLKTGSSQNLALFSDCDATHTTEDWIQLVQAGGTYGFSAYVLNTGTSPLYITYLPTDISTDGGQTRFHITVNVIGYGLPCQMVANNIPLPTGIAALPYALPEKSTATPNAGFPLNPNNMIKLSITVQVDSVDLSSQPTLGWMIPFEVCSAAV